MTRSFVSLLLVFAVLSIVLAWTLRPPTLLDARFAHSDCRRIDVRDPRTGAFVAGIEDLALGPDNDTLILSAHDRRTPRERGGLYRLSLWELGSGAKALAERIDPESIGSFRPHGIALSSDGKWLAVVDRGHPDGTAILTGPVGRIWRPERVLRPDGVCRANDVLIRGDGSVRVSLDRADCGTSPQDLLPSATTGRVIDVARNGAIRDFWRNLRFPNGLAGDWRAETRGWQISNIDGRSIGLPGGPDNLSETKDGTLIAALHPNLLRLGVVLRGWLDRAPSRIVSISPATGKVDVLFDDPDGAIYSAASVGVLSGETLVVGSATDKGLLLCGEGA